MVGSDAEVTTCREQDCTRPAARRGLCWGHLAQLKRRGVTGPLRERATSRRGRLERLERAAYQLADAERDDEYRRAWWRFWDAFRAAARIGKDMSPDGERIG